jgi:hypothetical protein
MFTFQIPLWMKKYVVVYLCVNCQWTAQIERYSGSCSCCRFYAHFMQNTHCVLIPAWGVLCWWCGRCQGESGSYNYCMTFVTSTWVWKYIGRNVAHEVSFRVWPFSLCIIGSTCQIVRNWTYWSVPSIPSNDFLTLNLYFLKLFIGRGRNQVHCYRGHLLAYYTSRGWQIEWQGKPKYSEKTFPSVVLCTTNLT